MEESQLINDMNLHFSKLPFGKIIGIKIDKTVGSCWIRFADDGEFQLNMGLGQTLRYATIYSTRTQKSVRIVYHPTFKVEAPFSSSYTDAASRFTQSKELLDFALNYRPVKMRRMGYCLVDIDIKAYQLEIDRLEAKNEIFAELRMAVKRLFAPFPFEVEKIEYADKWWKLSCQHIALTLTHILHEATLYQPRNNTYVFIKYFPQYSFHCGGELDSQLDGVVSKLKAFTKSADVYKTLNELYKKYCETRFLAARREICWFLLCCPKLLPLDVTRIVFDKLK